MASCDTAGPLRRTSDGSLNTLQCEFIASFQKAVAIETRRCEAPEADNRTAAISVYKALYPLWW